ncbi:dolichyl-phosphate beta-glucosyltransferase [Candidatus Methylomirabilis sp.]|uniref:dolichyl-phosphate beta-glucosyltransferase n=1 Tax=Candidatus Methylomirabilis sp. TaxID=2032687 RepID=UPI002A60CD06|nr:glycosyltransferase family 2 protein [Candidatus Methylomirabilis sp.]
MSIIIPAYNEANRIGASLHKIAVHFYGRTDHLEVIVVDDGSQDATSRIVESIAQAHPWIQLLRNAVNTGKGAAVRAGVLSAKENRIAFCDADLSAPIEELNELLTYLDKGFDIAISSRISGGPAKHVKRELFRRLMAVVFNRFVRFLLIRKIADTQCGLKAFTRPVALDLFAQQSITGFAFDVELLWRAQRAGHRIVEVPVSWVADPESRIRPWSDSLTMARDVISLWFHERVIPAWRGIAHG